MDKQKLYNFLPYPLKSLASSLWGLYLCKWRYGPGTESLVQETLDRDTWTKEQWTIWQKDRLAYILHRAATSVPYYRDQWQKRRIQGDRSSWELLENWPVLTKAKIRETPKIFLADNCNPRKMYVDHTGGTTGTPLLIFESRETVQKWYALYEARVRRWHQVSYKDRWAIFGGQMVVPLGQVKPPFWVENKSLHQLYFSTFHISEQNVKHYVQRINQYQPTHMVVYPSSVSEFSAEIIKQGLTVWHPKVIFSNAEPLYESQRKIISDAFKCKVVNTYGMGEIAFGASECKELQMHTWPDSGILEVLDENNNKVRDGESGSFILTGLTNHDMPLIRYEIGDQGRSHNLSSCKCECNLPILGTIEGRNSEMLITMDGRKIFWLNPVFYNLKVFQAQIIQEELDQIRVKVVPAIGFGPEDIETIISRLIDRVGRKSRVTVDQVDSIPREKNGKFRPVISQII